MSLELIRTGRVHKLSNTYQKKHGLPVGDEGVYGLRQTLADIFNREAKRHGLTLRADPRSYAERGIVITPTKHVGVHAVNRQRRGIESEGAAALAKVREENARKIAARTELIFDKFTRTEARG